ncbi:MULTISPECIES: hypothetical protein [unclassified Lysobacter]|uniref:hypothetical protein n=1 Tax=unclassified Lysobacter TaxID=2635362 RepID=UPI001C248642|nr:hypothetical protein [Lysobacter sp. MMG2]MBU8975815.1 hypothetical protein [Lysobacter sp. MMG2]
MNLYSGLLFLHGHVADADLARSLAGVEEPVPRKEERDTARVECGDGPRRRSSFHNHAVSFVCGTTALSPFR